MNLIEISNKFPDELSATLFFERKRWGKKPKCAYCGSTRVFLRTKDLRLKCKDCMKTFSVTIGTNLQGSKIPLKTWLYAFAIVTDAKKKTIGTTTAKKHWHELSDGFQCV